MSDVVFDEGTAQISVRPIYKRAYGGITKWLIEHDIARDERSANIVMLVATSAILVMTLLVFRVTFTKPEKVPFEQEREQDWLKQGHTGKPPPDFMKLPS